MGIVAAVAGRVPTMIAGPDSSTSAMVATIAALVAGLQIGEGHYSRDLFAPVILVLMAISAAAGFFMIALARMRGGRAMRYVPYPVIGGFLGATGWLVVSGAFRVITGESLGINSWSLLESPTALAQVAAAVGFAAIIVVATRRFHTLYALPLLVVIAVLTAHAAFVLSGTSVQAAQAGGWMFARQQTRTFEHLWTEIASTSFPWHIVPSIAGDMVAAILVTTVAALVNVTAIEVITHRETDLEHEVKVIGFANLASAAVGGYVGSASISRTALNERAGATGRLSGLVVALITALAVAVGPDALGYMPKFVVGGLLLYLGADQLYRWTIASWRKLSRTEYLSLLAIIVITAKFGFVAGLIIGTVIGCAIFAYSASRVSSIKFQFNGQELRSTLDRDSEESALLAARGREIVGLNLQSYLFFGSANRLYSHVKTIVADHSECRYFIFDFRLVTGIDSSAVYSFTQIKRHAAARGIRLVFVNLSRSTEKVLRSQAFELSDVVIMADLDRALEWCENQVIRAHQPGESERVDLLAWFTRALGNLDDAKRLLSRCRRVDVGSGAVIARAGEAANSMYFISDGRVGVMVNVQGARDTRVRSLGRHTMIGEMGLLARQPRSATLVAETASILYELDSEALAALRAESAALVERLLSYVVVVMAERLAYANRAISMLRR